MFPNNIILVWVALFVNAPFSEVWVALVYFIISAHSFLSSSCSPPRNFNYLDTSLCLVEMARCIMSIFAPMAFLLILEDMSLEDCCFHSSFSKSHAKKTNPPYL